MLGKSKKSASEKGLTLIAENCQVEGDVLFSDELVIQGVVKGNVIAQDGAKAHVRITDRGSVAGEIHAPNVVVNGKVCGDIHSNKHVELAAKAEVKGNVYYNLIEMVMGSRVDGNLVHVQEGKSEVRPAEVFSAGSTPSATPVTQVQSRTA